MALLAQLPPNVIDNGNAWWSWVARVGIGAGVLIFLIVMVCVAVYLMTRPPGDAGIREDE